MDKKTGTAQILVRKEDLDDFVRSVSICDAKKPVLHSFSISYDQTRNKFEQALATKEMHQGILDLCRSLINKNVEIKGFLSGTERSASGILLSVRGVGGFGEHSQTVEFVVWASGSIQRLVCEPTYITPLLGDAQHLKDAINALATDSNHVPVTIRVMRDAQNAHQDDTVLIQYNQRAPIWKSVYKCIVDQSSYKLITNKFVHHEPKNAQTGLFPECASVETEYKERAFSCTLIHSVVFENESGSDWKEGFDITFLGEQPLTFSCKVEKPVHVSRHYESLLEGITVLQGGIPDFSSNNKIESGKMAAGTYGAHVQEQKYDQDVTTATMVEDEQDEDDAVQQQSIPDQAYSTRQRVSGGDKTGLSKKLGMPSTETHTKKSKPMRTSKNQTQAATTAFSYTVTNVGPVKNGDSMCVCVDNIASSTKQIQIVREYVYDPRHNKAHPISAVRLYNHTKKPIAPGLVTFGQQSSSPIMGDSKMPYILAGGSQTVAVGLETRITILKQESNAACEYVCPALSVQDGLFCAHEYEELEYVYDCTHDLSLFFDMADTDKSGCVFLTFKLESDCQVFTGRHARKQDYLDEIKATYIKHSTNIIVAFDRIRQENKGVLMFDSFYNPSKGLYESSIRVPFSKTLSRVKIYLHRTCKHYIALKNIAVECILAVQEAIECYSATAALENHSDGHAKQSVTSCIARARDSMDVLDRDVLKVGQWVERFSTHAKQTATDLATLGSLFKELCQITERIKSLWKTFMLSLGHASKAKTQSSITFPKQDKEAMTLVDAIENASKMKEEIEELFDKHNAAYAIYYPMVRRK
jgi:hypothetical protein